MLDVEVVGAKRPAHGAASELSSGRTDPAALQGLKDGCRGRRGKRAVAGAEGLPHLAVGRVDFDAADDVVALFDADHPAVAAGHGVAEVADAVVKHSAQRRSSSRDVGTTNRRPPWL